MKKLKQALARKLIKVNVLLCVRGVLCCAVLCDGCCCKKASLAAPFRHTHTRREREPPTPDIAHYLPFVLSYASSSFRLFLSFSIPMIDIKHHHQESKTIEPPHLLPPLALHPPHPLLQPLPRPLRLLPRLALLLHRLHAIPHPAPLSLQLDQFIFIRPCFLLPAFHFHLGLVALRLEIDEGFLQRGCQLLLREEVLFDRFDVALGLIGRRSGVGEIGLGRCDAVGEGNVAGRGHGRDWGKRDRGWWGWERHC